jgi:hypothetical protein
MAMVSILLQLPQEGSDNGEEERQFFFKLGMAAVPEANSSLPISDPVDLNVFEKQLTGHYWRYQGSMTYPPCTEGVKWIVAASPAHINARAVAAFKRRFTGVVRNRPVMPENDRKVQMGVLEDIDHPTCHDGHPDDGTEVASAEYVWKTSQDNTCKEYLEYQWCTSSGGYGVGWQAEWGVFSNFVDDYGYGANDACCGCGGGVNLMPHGVVPVATTTAKPNISYAQWNPALAELDAEVGRKPDVVASLFELDGEAGTKPGSTIMASLSELGWNADVFREVPSTDEKPFSMLHGHYVASRAPALIEVAEDDRSTMKESAFDDNDEYDKAQIEMEIDDALKDM